jgi:hypothetical protein
MIEETPNKFLPNAGIPEGLKSTFIFNYLRPD